MRHRRDVEARLLGRGSRVALVRLVAASVAAAAAVAADPAQAVRRGDFTLAAHRGYHAVVTENTIGALNAADDYGASAMETDLRLTSDGYMVVMHDATLGRTTTCRGWVDERTKRGIRRRCRAEDRQAIPFATDLLRAAWGQYMNLLIELKRDRQGRWDNAQLQRLSDLIDSRGMRDRVMISSVEPAALGRMESVAPWLPTMWIATTPPTVEKVEANGSDSVSASAANLSTQLVTDLNAAGHEVYGRVSDQQADWEAYRSHGVAGVVTNAVPQYLQWAGSPS